MRQCVSKAMHPALRPVHPSLVAGPASPLFPCPPSPAQLASAPHTVTPLSVLTQLLRRAAQHDGPVLGLAADLAAVQHVALQAAPLLRQLAAQLGGHLRLQRAQQLAQTHQQVLKEEVRKEGGGEVGGRR